MLNFIILTILSVPPILAALSRQDMASALIAAEDTGTLEETFKKFEKEQDYTILSLALADVAKVQGHMPKVAACLRMAHDSFPNDKMRMSKLVCRTFSGISVITDTESFTNLITSFKPSDIKLLAAIRGYTLIRSDGVNVLEKVMAESPELITDDLPGWIASHGFDRNSYFINRTAIEKAFQYLISFAAQSVLEQALDIVKRNEHYKIDSAVRCCGSQERFPQDLFNKIEALLELAKVRETLINVLTSLPKVPVDLMLDYAIVPDCSTLNTETSVSVLGKRSSRLQSRASHKKSKGGK